MIWVLLILGVNLPQGAIVADQITGFVYLTEVECQAEKVKLARFLTEVGGNLNAGCISVPHNAPTTPARPRVQS